MVTENRYYVYFYLREDGTPYYVGKGKEKRAWQKHSTVSVPKDIYKILIVSNNLTEQEALELEREKIKFYGRKDLGTGILRNLTDGGEGTSGFKHKDISKNKMSLSKSGNKNPKYWSGKRHKEETKLKISQSKTGVKINRIKPGRKLSEREKLEMSKRFSGERHPFFGKNHKEETKLKISQSKIGQKRSLESIQKQMETRKTKNIKPNYRQTICPHCNKTGVSFNMTRYHFENCRSIKIGQ